MSEQAPDLERLRTALAAARTAADWNGWQYADGPAYYEGKAKHEAAVHKCTRLARELAELEQIVKARRQLIGIARRALAVPPESHAALVTRLTGDRTSSTTGCTLDELEQILTWYRERGFRPTKPRRAGRAPSQDAMDRATMLKRVEQLLTVQQLPWRYAEAMLRQRQGVTDKAVVYPVETCSDADLKYLIAALDKRRKRQEQKA